MGPYYVAPLKQTENWRILSDNQVLYVEREELPTVGPKCHWTQSYEWQKYLGEILSEI